MATNTTEEQIRKAQNELTPDEQLALANAAKGTSGGYTNTPAASSIAGLDRVVTPTPVQETITPVQPVINNPYTDFIKTLQKPITPEEEARRERAARAVQGVAGLGNLMSAFANLTFTGKGAPSQTLPTQSVDAMTDRTTSWKDKLKAEREKYQAAELGAKVEQWKAELDAQHRAQQQANVDRAFEYQKSQDEKLAAERAQAREDKLAEDARKQSNWEKEQEAKKEYNKGMLDIYGRRADIQQQNADTNASRTTAASIRAAAAAGKKSVPVVWDSNGVGATVHLATDKLSPANLEQISLNLPEEVKSRYGITKYTRTAEYDDKVLQAIGAELQAGNNAVYNILDKLGVLTLPTATTIPNNQSVNPAITMPGVDTNMTMPGV